jgi:hypothetical protein
MHPTRQPRLSTSVLGERETWDGGSLDSKAIGGNNKEAPTEGRRGKGPAAKAEKNMDGTAMEGWRAQGHKGRRDLELRPAR